MKEISFFAGVVSMNAAEERCLPDRPSHRTSRMDHDARRIQRLDGSRRARCHEHGGRVIALGLADVQWGDFNSFVDETVVAPTTGERLERLFGPTALSLMPEE